MCEMIGSIHFSKASVFTQFFQLLFLFIAMPLVLFLITAILGVMLAYLNWESCCKDHCIAMLNRRSPSYGTSSLFFKPKKFTVMSKFSAYLMLVWQLVMHYLLVVKS